MRKQKTYKYIPLEMRSENTQLDFQPREAWLVNHRPSGLVPPLQPM